MTPEVQAAADTLPRNLVWLDPSELMPHPKNTHQDLAKDPRTTELLALIEQHEQQQPCVVRPLDGLGNPKRYQIVIGHRRTFVASQLNRKVWCWVRDDLDEQTALLLMLADGGSFLTPEPLAESDAIASLMAPPEQGGHGWSVKAVSEALGKTPRFVATRANLRNLTKKSRDAWRTRENMSRWTLDMVEEWAKLAPEAQDDLLDRVNHVRDRRGLDHALAEQFHVLGKAPWDLEDVGLVPKAGSCSACPKTSIRSPGLFEDELDDLDVRKATCRDLVCWRKKGEAHTLRQINAAKKEDSKTLLLEGKDRSIHSGLPKGIKGDQVLRDHEVRRVPKNTPGARPAVVVTGEKVGTKVHVVSTRDEPRSGSQPKPKPKVDDRTEAERLKDSRAKVAARRDMVLVDKIRELIRDRKTSPGFNPTMALVAAYEISAPSSTWGPALTRRRAIFARVDSKGDVFAEEVWPRLRGHIAQTIFRRNPQDLPREVEAALWLAKILKIDVEKIRKDAIAEIPDPRWWASASSPAPTKTKAPSRKKGAARG